MVIPLTVSDCVTVVLVAFLGGGIGPDGVGVGGAVPGALDDGEGVGTGRLGGFVDPPLHSGPTVAFPPQTPWQSFPACGD